MRASTPEELECLLEDAFVTADPDALSETFAEGAVFVVEGSHHEARGAGEIRRLASRLWGSAGTYIADARRVVQARDTALVLGRGSVNVLRRDISGAWRYVIAVVALEQPVREVADTPGAIGAATGPVVATETPLDQTYVSVPGGDTCPA